MTTELYIKKINERFKLGNATEHTFRGDLQTLIESLVPTIRATNEPKRQSCGAPDYILTKKDIPIGFIEAKDIGDKDLKGNKTTGNKEQFDRYKSSLNNIIFTDYIDFYLYRDGQIITEISIGEVTPKGIKPIQENFEKFDNLIKDFCSYIGQSIKSPKRLAEMMAGKARLLSDVIEKSLTSDEKSHDNSTLKDQMNAFKEVLIHDIKPKEFADVYAQTIAYGMFAARLNDPSIKSFTRQEAAELIPKSNPFLRKLFGYIAGPEIDDRIKWIVDSLTEIFLHCNVEEILKSYGRSTKTEDPIIHFYETFLSEYDPHLRKSRGVWYTPKPVVSYIVRAVDYILKTEFNLDNGLANTEKIKIKVEQQGRKLEQEIHKVQILDPATGTGTFLSEVIKIIYSYFEEQKGIWPSYVEKHLLPRLNGFEILMASYAMAHMKLDLLLSELGYKSNTGQRFRVYLTNSLEESHPDTGTLFTNWLSTEANEANYIKRDTPVMCIIGNPPYSGESSNQGDWIMKLMEDYKKEPGGREKLKEKNPKWINDDYVKFLRYGQYFIEKNKSGILAYITPHGFLDNPTFRGMRWSLLKTYDKIYTLDLHGNSKKKEVAQDGSPDSNVFDIMQGVSINIFVKTGAKKENELARVFHFDLLGKREMKYNFLHQESIQTVNYTELEPKAPNYFFVKKDFTGFDEYNEGFGINELFITSGTGIVSKRDSLAFKNSEVEIKNVIQDIKNLSCDDIKSKYDQVSWESRDGKVEFCKANVMKFGLKEDLFIQCSYRPFDNKWTYYTGESKGFIGWPVKQIMKHFLKGDNIGLAICKQYKTGDSYQHVFISEKIIESSFVSNRTSEITSFFPLYLYDENKEIGDIDNSSIRKPNLNKNILDRFSKIMGWKFVSELSKTDGCFSPIEILDYIYAKLHSPNYRKKYNEFLKSDFPKIPFPKSSQSFRTLAKLGKRLRELHLLKNIIVSREMTQFPISGSNIIEKLKYQDERIYINDTQYFNKVPSISWDFFVGGYQPAQKWLKDRKGKMLDFEDISHYQKIIYSLFETSKIMSEISCTS